LHTGEGDFDVSEQGNTHLPQLSSIEKCFFEEVCPVTACRALMVLDSMCNNEEQDNVDCNPHFVFLCGLTWLHTASVDGIFSVTAAIGMADATDSTCLLAGLDCADWRSLFRSHWGFRAMSKSILAKAGPAAFFIATIVEHYAIQVMPRTRGEMKDRCQEAHALCSLWHFWLCPDIDRYHNALGLWKSRTMSPEYNPAHFLDQVLQSEWCAPTEEDADETLSDSDDELMMRRYVKPGDKETAPPAVPLLQQRVSLAVSHNLISEAHNLCVVAGQKGNAWNTEIDSSERLGLVSACLTVMHAASGEGARLLGDEFIAVAMQAVLSINWLQTRVDMSESNYATIASQRHPRDEHIDILLACADEWSSETVLNADLDHCARILRLVSACIRFRNARSLGKKTCSMQQGSNENRRCKCAERAKKRQRVVSTKQSSSDVPVVAIDLIAKYIDELKLLADQLQLPEAKLWYESAKIQLASK